MNPIAAGLMVAVAVATGIYGRHLETDLAALKKQMTELEKLRKWDQDRLERLQRQILDLRMNIGEAKGNFSTTKVEAAPEAANDGTRG